MNPPPFPPNREIREGESCCAVCGSGKSTHDDGTRNHPFTKQSGATMSALAYLRGCLGRFIDFGPGDARLLHGKASAQKRR